MTGITSEYLLIHFPQLTLLCVDPYVSYENQEADRTSGAMSRSEQEAHERLARFDSRVRVLKLVSASAALQVANDSLDFVFIDAIHSYQAVTEDVEAWFPKVRSGGVIAGHDVSWPGIREAVHDFIAPRTLAAFYTPSTSDVWFFINPLHLLDARAKEQAAAVEIGQTQSLRLPPSQRFAQPPNDTVVQVARICLPHFRDSLPGGNSRSR